MDLGVGTGSSEWRDGKEGGDGRKVKRAKEDDGMGEEGLLAAGWGSMDYGVSRAEQWRRRRRRSINNSASEQRGGGDSLLPRAQESRCCRVQQGGRERSHLLPLPASDRQEGRRGTFAKFHFANDGRLSSAQTASGL